MRIPGKIHQGNTIGVAAPSFGATVEPYITRFDAAVQRFSDMGYTVIPGKCCFKSDGLGISTNPEAAARELEYMYTNPSVNAVISCGGGELMCETAGNINFYALKEVPAKWFMGYSDNTNFIFPLVTICETAAIYGPCFPTFGKPWEKSEEDAMALLEGKTDTVSGYEMFQSPEADSSNENPLSAYILDEKKYLISFTCSTKKAERVQDQTQISIRGTLLGGCLDVLNNLAGTNLDNMKAFKEKYRNIIWVLEACDYNTMDIRRALWHLDKCGWFEDAAGFVFGRPLAAFRQKVMGVDQYNAVTDILQKYGKPIICDADIGHIDPAMPIVMGAEAEITVTGNSITVKHQL